MRTVSYKLADLGKVVIHLGKMAENDARGAEHRGGDRTSEQVRPPSAAGRAL